MSTEPYADEVVELRGRVAALERDAARYRWLRAQSWVFCELEQNSDVEYETTDEDFVDSAIDSAMDERGL